MPADCLLALAELPLVPAPDASAGWLDDAERERLEGMSAERRRQQFLGGHWLVRQLACERFGGEPRDWRWQVDARGKPSLLRDSQAVEIAVSHSEGWIVGAVADEPVGIDLEVAQRQRDWLALAGHVLSSVESEAITALPLDEQRRAFIERWALHEAWGKRDGTGVLPSRMRRRYFLECEPQVADARSWTLPMGSLAVCLLTSARIECRGLERACTPRYWRSLPA